MVQLYKNIKKLRNELQMTQTELAEKLGYADKSMIAKIEKGQVDLTQSKIMAFAEALHVSASDLMGWDSEDDVTLPPCSNILPIGKQTLPVLGKIACGKPIMMNEEREFYTVKGTKIKADYILIASGDSMINARIHDGDVVFIRKQSTVENGEIAAVTLDDENATLKRFYYYQQQAMIVLRAENPKYEDLIFTGEQLADVHILGKAIGFQGNVL